MTARLAIVVPCFNEEEVLPDSIGQLKKLLGAMKEDQKISKDSFLLLVDDGSSDDTWNIIQKEHRKDASAVWGLKLSRNEGHQNALLAGLMSVKDRIDISISIDADLQDDISVIPDMVESYYRGNELVFGVRNNRDSDSWFKRNSAKLFYHIMKWLGVQTIEDHADFRLMSRRALDELDKYKERNLFLRGIVTCIGFQTDQVFYTRKKRTAGKSKYTFSKMVSLAFQGITSFSTKPMMMIFCVGIISVLISFGAILYSLIGHFIGHTVAGWTSLFCSVWLLGGLILLAIGIVGQYIGNIYMEVKERPRYHIETELFDQEDDKD